MTGTQLLPDPRYTELEGLVTSIPDPLQRQRAEHIVKTLTDSDRRRKMIMKHVTDALAQLRVDMKYLIFDLECTRKERDDLKG